MTNFELIKSHMEPTTTKLECNCPSFDFDVATITDGSEKQITWAANIQYGYVKEFGAWARMMEEKGKIKNVGMVKDLFIKIFSNNTAKYWISNKGRNIQLIMQENMK